VFESAAVCVDAHPLATVQIAATAIIIVVSFIVNAPPVFDASSQSLTSKTMQIHC
jgi:hypothetical protein